MSALISKKNRKNQLFFGPLHCDDLALHVNDDRFIITFELINSDSCSKKQWYELVDIWTT